MLNLELPELFKWRCGGNISRQEISPLISFSNRKYLKKKLSLESNVMKIIRSIYSSKLIMFGMQSKFYFHSLLI